MSGGKKYIIAFSVAVIFFLFFYRATVASGFDLLPGGSGDARLNIILADSWRDYFTGRLPLGETRIFHPYRGTQGYTDLNLSLFLLELPFRWLGLDEILSAQAVYVLLFFLGVMTMFHLCHRLFGISFHWSIVCSLFAFLNNAFWLKQQHTQFYFLCLVPLLGICVFRYLQYWGSGPALRRILYGMGAAIIFSVISYSNFYSAFFFAVWAVPFFAFFLMIRIRRDRIPLDLDRKKICELVGLLLFLLLLHGPFLQIYLPLVRSGVERPWSTIAGGLPAPTDIFNIGEMNFLWGGLYQRFYPNIHKGFYENTYGIPPITLLLTVGMLAVFFLRWKKKEKLPAWVIAFIISMGIIFILTLRPLPLDSRFFPYLSPWYFFRWIPGASAIRAMNRIYVFLMLPLSVFIGWMLTGLEQEFSRRAKVIVFILIAGLLLLDNFNLHPVSFWKYSDYRRQLDAVAAPPPGCKVFFIAPEELSDLSQLTDLGLDAWDIAKRFDLVTINGYSGHFPPDWLPFLHVPTPGEYKQGIDSWIRRYSLKDVYVYDRRINSWSRYPAP